MKPKKPARQLPQPPAPPLPKLAYTVLEAAQVSGLGKTTIWEEISAGRLKKTRVRGRTLIREETLRAYLAQREAEGAE
jgi:excisionase family DNA binding protein